MFSKSPLLAIIVGGIFSISSCENEDESVSQNNSPRVKKEIDELKENNNKGILLTPKKIEGKYGYVNQKGDVVLPPKWDKAEDFRHGVIARVELDGERFTIDKSGKRLTKEEFKEIYLPISVKLAEERRKAKEEGMVKYADVDPNQKVFPEPLKFYYKGSIVTLSRTYVNVDDKGHGRYSFPFPQNDKPGYYGTTVYDPSHGVAKFTLVENVAVEGTWKDCVDYILEKIEKHTNDN